MYNSITKDWREHGIKIPELGIIVAPEDYHEGDKYLFTWEEAMEISKKLPDGWRLATMGEWAMIAEEYGYGKLSDAEVAKDLQNKLGLVKRGYISAHDNELRCKGDEAYYWSSTAHASIANLAQILSFTTSNVNPATIIIKRVGYAVRCVAPLDLQKDVELTSAEDGGAAKPDEKREEGTPICLTDAERITICGALECHIADANRLWGKIRGRVA